MVVGTAGAACSTDPTQPESGLLAWLGSVGLGLSLILQLWWRQGGVLDPLTQSWGLQTLWCQALVTGLLAPVLVSLQLLLWRRRVPS